MQTANKNECLKLLITFFAEIFSKSESAQVAKTLGIDAIEYGLSKWKGELCSTCELFTSKEYSFLASNSSFNFNILFLNNFFGGLYPAQFHQPLNQNSVPACYAVAYPNRLANLIYARDEYLSHQKYPQMPNLQPNPNLNNRPRL